MHGSRGEFWATAETNATPFSQARNTRFSKEGTMPYRGGNRDESAYASVIGYCIL